MQVLIGAGNLLEQVDALRERIVAGEIEILCMAVCDVDGIQWTSYTAKEDTPFAWARMVAASVQLTDELMKEEV